MKNIKIIILFAVIIIAENIISQADTSAVYYLPQVEITQLKHKKIISYTFIEQDKNKFILSDSLLIADPDIYNYRVKISDIRRMSFRNGSHFWTGAAVVGGAGFLLGFLVGGYLNDFGGGGSDKPFNIEHGLLGGLICGIPTALIGGLIGSMFHKYEDYYMTGMAKDYKPEMLKKILKKNKIKPL